jgi:proteasome activator subunit 4
MAMLEPSLIMPELLERAHGGLEVVNETHRTTAVLTVLNAISRTLVSEKLWFGGQKHLVPLLELSLPGIDLVSRFGFPSNQIAHADRELE